ncbi:MAG: DNA primase [Lachnospiraceae bacterium]|nr:DNA primase [Lachnospiraceae bacterium]
MYYSEEIIEEVRSRNDIVDIISGYVALKKQGNNYFGICPFHNEKSPSFSVNRRGQFFHCFGCGKGGNVFTFVCEYENFSFPEAVKFLADRSGIALPEVEMTPEMKKHAGEKQKLMEIQKEAATFYYYQLRNESGSTGLEYFKNDRKLSDETMKKFGLGYSLKYTDAMYRYLKEKGYEDELIQKSGLCDYSEKYGFNDKFINRVMFPIFDIHDKVIAFGGRVMGDGKPKYLNSPETPIFNKSRTVYGLNFARTSRKDRIIMCEGYMDVIAMHQGGFTEACASLGTAFTYEQANLIKRYSKNIYLAYDSDGAGTAAALKNIKILHECGLGCRVIDLKPCKDPDEFLKTYGPEEFEKRIENATNGFMFEIGKLREEYPPGNPDDETNFQKETAKKLCRYKDELERDNYLKAVCREYGIQEKLMEDYVRKVSSAMELKGDEDKDDTALTGLKSGRKEAPSADDAIKNAQRAFLTFIVEDPPLYIKLKDYISVTDFTDPLYCKVAGIMFEEIESDGFNPGAIISSFPETDDQRLVAEIFSTKVGNIEGDSQKNQTIKDLIIKIRDNAISDYQLKNATDGNAIMKTIKDRKALDEFKHKELNLY